MIKVKSSIATRENIPPFLFGLALSSLADLSWTDPTLGVQDAAWWPEEDQSPALQQFERYGDETLTPDHERRVVIVTRAVVPWSAEEIAEYQAVEAARIRREIMDGVQRYLDDFATTKTYDSMLSACTYATSTVSQFAKEGQYCVEKRDECWATVARIEAEVLAGTRPAPTGFDDIKGELPALEWPAA